jgi:hypothetical protein
VDRVHRPWVLIAIYSTADGAINIIRASYYHTRHTRRNKDSDPGMRKTSLEQVSNRIDEDHAEEMVPGRINNISRHVWMPTVVRVQHIHHHALDNLRNRGTCTTVGDDGVVCCRRQEAKACSTKVLIQEP